MKLLFLHGAPAAGKLTVAKALLQLLPGRLFDNHAAIDLARTLFDFGAPGFWELVHEHPLFGARRRGGARRSACRHDLLLMPIRTTCRSSRNSKRLCERHGGELLPVFLHCSREEAARRVGNPDRVERRKMTSAAGLVKELDDLQIHGGAARRLPRAGYRNEAGGGDRAGNHWPFWVGRGAEVLRTCKEAARIPGSCERRDRDAIKIDGPARCLHAAQALQGAPSRSA